MRACPVCHNSEPVHFYDKPPDVLTICPECRHVFWGRSPSVEELESYYAHRYSAAHNQQAIQQSNAGYYERHIVELLAAVRVPKESVRFLDFGCSIPVLLRIAKSMGVGEVIGVDYDEEAHRFGKEHGVRMITSPEIDSCLEDGSLHIVRCSHALEHVQDPGETLSRLVRKLRRDGVVFITQPNIPVFNCAPSSTDLKDTVYPEHLHFFSPISLMEMVTRSGLVVRRFFTHGNETQGHAAYGQMLDLEYGRTRLARWRSAGDGHFGPLNNYPFYLGENSVVWAAL